MFSIVYPESPILVWAPIVDSDTIYVGQIVECQGNEGIAPIAAAAGANDTTGKIVPFGVVVGLSNYVPSFDATYKTEKIVDATPLASTADFRLVGGLWPKNDHVAYAHIALIDATTILKGDIFNAAVGTAITVGTLTAGDSVSATSSALEVAGVATLATLYFRTGSNAGSYRITDDASTTALTWDKPLYVVAAVGDTVVRANGLRLLGPSRVQFDSESIYINNAAALTVDYYGVDVVKLDLREAGKEHVYFRFNADHFCLTRA